MGFFKKKIDLEKGKKLFFQYNGSITNIDIDGLRSEYRHCNIPKELEQEWLKEIEDEILYKIKNELVMDELDNLFGKLSFLNIPIERKVYPITNYLKNNKLDTFTIIRFCEELKLIKRNSRYEKVPNTALCSEIDEIVKFYANKLLSEPIIVDDSYKNSRHMQNYDFSDENIKKRIQDLFEIIIVKREN